MKSKARKSVWAALWILAVLLTVFLFCSKQDTIRPVSLRDEQAAADTVLAEKLSGPRYFNAPLVGIKEEGGPWIEVDEARRQLPGILKERKLGGEARRDIDLLISQLAESHPYRMVGGERINLPRLNLSLDSIK